MKNSKVFFTVCLLGFLVVTNSCEKKAVPEVTTSEISNITANTATCGGSIDSEGSSTIMARGVCWSTDPTPTLNDSKTTDGAGAGSFTSNLTGLDGGTIYFVRAYASNSVGTGYGMAMSFTSLGQTPLPTFTSVSDITTSSAKLNGAVNANYLSTVVTFEYGTTTNYGNSVTAIQSPVEGNTNVIVSANIDGLNPGCTYYARIKADNSLGTTYSEETTFLTLGQTPDATTVPATSVTLNTLQFNGSVNANYLSTIVTFEYGTTTSYGSTMTALQSPIEGNMVTSASANLTGLTSGVTYHFRIKAVNSLGTTYGEDMLVTIPSYGAVSDMDGNVYDTIAIGVQVWMQQNLNTTKFSNGEPIPTTTPANLNISGETNPTYQWTYDGIESNAVTYGRLYTWYTVTDTRNVCPYGWHVPTDVDWTTLRTFLGDVFNAAGKLKEPGTNHWVSSNPEVTNESGFTALPAGTRDYRGGFSMLGMVTEFWSSEASDWYIVAFENGFYGNTNNLPKEDGLSVRCIRDF